MTPSVDQTKHAKFNFIKMTVDSVKFVADMFSYKSYQKNRDSSRVFNLPPSIQQHMRLKEYDRQNGVFLMDDGINYAAVYEIRGFPTEGRDTEVLKSYASMMQQIVNVFPRHTLKNNPYQVQTYVNDEPDMFSWYERLKNYASPEIRKTKLNKVYLAMAQEHMKFMCKEGGAFTDSYTGNVFKGGDRVTRLVFYRKAPFEKGKDRLKEIKKVCRDLDAKLKNFGKRGLSYRRYDDRDVFHWLFSTFNKKVKGYDAVTDYLEDFPYQDEVENRPYGYNFMENAFNTGIKSNEEHKSWQVGQTYHRHLSCLGLSATPDVGKITAERKVADGVYESFFDNMPEYSMLHMTFVCQSEQEVVKDIDEKAKAAGKSSSTDAEMQLEEARYWKREIQKRNYLFPTQIGCYVSATSEDQLDEHYDQARSEMINAGFDVLDEEFDVYAMDKFLRFLPANYDHKFDKNYISSRYVSVKHLARMLPIGYARNKGTGNPLFTDYNRNGEPVTYDILKDLSNNPHMLALGTTGAGKSVRLCNMVVQMMAILRPYLTIIDAGGSFEFLVDYLEYMGLSVNRIVITRPQEGKLPSISLNPYYETKAMVKQIEELEKLQDLVSVIQDADDRVNEAIQENSVKDEGTKAALKDLFKEESLSEEDDAESSDKSKSAKEQDKKDDLEDQRDYVAEFQLASLLMACGGKDPEEVGITYDHRSELLAAVIETAKETVASGRDQMVTTDIVAYIKKKTARLQESKYDHEKEQANQLRLVGKRLEDFIKIPMNNLYFNRPAKKLEVVDVTYFEMGKWKDGGDSNKAPRALAFITMMSRISAQAEARQKEDRFSYFIGDEFHVVTEIKEAAAAMQKVAKMARKIGLYLLLATQNVSDFTENAAKMLSMFEFWMCLEMSMTEFEQVTQYVEVSDLEKKLFKTIHNDKGVYTEAVLLSKRLKLLVRCYPFREILYLAFNEQKEKNARLKLAKEYGCDEVEAALMQAQKSKGQPYDLELIREKYTRVAV
jgi:conjugative transfer ATPase